MKIYATHSSSYDYKNEFYQPLRASELNLHHKITLPHEHSTEQFNSKEFLKDCDLVVAEVSYPSTGQGIELGWADIYKIPIVCIHRIGTKPSASIKRVSNNFVEYENNEDMIWKLTDYLLSIKK